MLTTPHASNRSAELTVPRTSTHPPALAWLGGSSMNHEGGENRMPVWADSDSTSPPSSSRHSSSIRWPGLGSNTDSTSRALRAERPVHLPGRDTQQLHEAKLSVGKRITWPGSVPHRGPAAT